MAKYDLTGSLEYDFTFSIGDKEFRFKKPTVREMRAVSKLFASIEKEEDVELQERLSDDAMSELYKFVEPINHDRDIKGLLEDQTIEVQIAFNDMIKKELGAKS